MKDLSEKRKLRQENKKKKMAALLDITKLNEYDRAVRKSQIVNVGHEQNTQETLTVEQEPSPKRQKTSCLTKMETEIIQQPPPTIGSTDKPRLSGAEFMELKKMLREKTKQIRALPKLRLREMGENAKITIDIDSRIPLFLSDIQHLIMYSQVGVHAPYSPARWCVCEKPNKLKNVNVFIVENVSLYNYSSHASLFPFLSYKYEFKLEIISPNNYKSDIVKELSMVPLSGQSLTSHSLVSQMKKYTEKYGTIEAAVAQSNDVFDTVRNCFPMEETPEDTGSMNGLPSEDNFSRTDLLLSGWQMVEENFPLPIIGLMERKYKDYILTKDRYKDVTPYSPMFALDCEMCMTNIKQLELTRVSIVDENHQIVYETLVKPKNPIVDYLTRYSGITQKMMKDITTTLEEVQKNLRRILPADAILIGQSLSNDMHSLKMMHPYIIDTSIIYNITGERQRKTKLQVLARQFLDVRIQESKQGHCSTEDSLACMKLVQLKLKKHLYYGDAVMGSIFNEIPDSATFKYASSMLKQCTKTESTANVIGVDDIANKYKYYIAKDMVEVERINCVSEKSNAEVVHKFCETMSDYKLNIGHIRIPNNQLEDRKNKTFKNIDKWIKEIHQTSKMPCLNMVIFGGQKDNGNGVCFINLNTEIIK